MDFLQEQQLTKVMVRIKALEADRSGLLEAEEICQSHGLYGALAEIRPALGRVEAELEVAIAERDELTEASL